MFGFDVHMKRHSESAKAEVIHCCRFTNVYQNPNFQQPASPYSSGCILSCNIESRGLIFMISCDNLHDSSCLLLTLALMCSSTREYNTSLPDLHRLFIVTAIQYFIEEIYGVSKAKSWAFQISNFGCNCFPLVCPPWPSFPEVLHSLSLLKCQDFQIQVLLPVWRPGTCFWKGTVNLIPLQVLGRIANKAVMFSFYMLSLKKN